MKRHSIIILTALLTTLLLGGCGEPEPTYVYNENPDNKEAYLKFLSEMSTTVDAKAQEVVFDLVSTHKQFDIKVDRKWCTAEVRDNNKLVVSVEKNEFGNNRVATITIITGIEDNVTAPQSVSVYQGPGEIAIPKVGDIYGTGVVYWASTAAADAGFRTVSLKRAYGLAAQWSIDFQETGMTDKNDGLKNVEKIEFLNEYPAFNFCATMEENMGKGWYLPALNEWDDIFLLYNGGITPTKGLPTAAEQEARAAFEAFLAANGGDPFNAFVASSNGDSYWTSTESSLEDAYCVLTHNHKILEGSKTGSKRGARCVQYFDLK
ncbi:MAG: hypothetical protein IKM41_07155 [Tidjanibacter sp.]|nr:hypothetical protein [Tidjanibacter sp.]